MSAVLGGLALLVLLPLGVASGHERHPLPRIGAVREVDDADVADPAVLTYGGRYYVFWTTDWQSNVPAAVSGDRTHWQQLPDALPVLPSWAAPSISMTWAPAVVAVDGHFVMYVTTEDQATGRQCIAVAVAPSQDPAGPYTSAASEPLECQLSLGGSIDPSVVKDAGGLHLLWKNDGNCCNIVSSLWEQDLAPDGLSLVGTAHKLLTADEPWQGGVIEAPAMIRATGAVAGWWLFYSGGSWRSDDYATGLAYCKTVAGPCAEASSHPFLPSSPGLLSPGGLETFTDGSGRTWVAFSSFVQIPSPWHPGHDYDNRVLDLAPLLTN